MSLTEAIGGPSLAAGHTRLLVQSQRPRSFRSDAAERLFKNRAATASLVFIAVVVFVAASAPWIAPYPYDEQHMDRTWQNPSAQHWLGTDGFGRDILSRLMYGARVSLTVAIMAQVIILMLGVPLGLVGLLRLLLDHRVQLPVAQAGAVDATARAPTGL